mmetsp:Transcript_14725/g.22815  ORF Transcript_14725/g.22815 Transcript_14725/m.22815 type:complete len:227 (-) Transcript_14725:2560-3240(-)|eukprot:CAMPEP_0170480214 /NCGR_PEP_ID=MMETSP0208-20121228/1144_1 /TAXON_ID=197538 /ORGANISM="Strombidium inclinatum, Strain S3" /LENGTH=226 /DNA_ID=CAMNT_0010752725 /DNA_START=3238 /DNA_END=3918 /DNA_ORIENTATION=-
MCELERLLDGLASLSELLVLLPLELLRVELLEGRCFVGHRLLVAVLSRLAVGDLLFLKLGSVDVALTSSGLVLLSRLKVPLLFTSQASSSGYLLLGEEVLLLVSGRVVGGSLTVAVCFPLVFKLLVLLSRNLVAVDIGAFAAFINGARAPDVISLLELEISLVDFLLVAGRVQLMQRVGTGLEVVQEGGLVADGSLEEFSLSLRVLNSSLVAGLEDVPLSLQALDL